MLVSHPSNSKQILELEFEYNLKGYSTKSIDIEWPQGTTETRQILEIVQNSNFYAFIIDNEHTIDVHRKIDNKKIFRTTYGA